jgi:hypothetical protein
VIVPDYISPVIGYRAWRWKATGLQSLNGSPWLPGRPMVAGCGPRAGTIASRAESAHGAGADELPHADCTCGVYAAKNLEHLRQIGYTRRGIRGEVYLWGTVVEHRLGWRAQFAYPKSLFLPPTTIPFKLTEMEARLKTLIAFGADIFLVSDHESIRFWTNDSGFDAVGVEYLLKTRHEYYVRHRQERTLRKGDRVAVLGRGIAVVEQTDDQGALVVVGKRLAIRIALKDIVLNEQYMRWEYGAANARANDALRKP